MARGPSRLPVVAVPYGEPLYAALARMIEAAKRGDPLAPVTIAVPSNYAALHARRWLARNAKNGVANVRTMPLPRIAELLGGPALADHGQRPLTVSAMRAAVRATLREHPGPFAEVALAPATVEALVPALQEAWDQGSDVLNELSRAKPDWEPFLSDLQARIRPFFRASSLWASAVQAIHDANAALTDLGPVILFAPRHSPGAETEFLAALRDRVGLGVVVGLTGMPVHDGPRCEAYGAEPSKLPAPEASPHQWWSLPEAEDEIREVASAVLNLAERGVGLSRIAVVSVNAEPYASIARERLRGTGIPMAGRPRRTLAESHAGRVVLGALRLPEANWSWRAVRDWMTSFPLIWEEGVAPTESWMQLARRAGVHQGWEAWSSKLETYARRTDARRRAEIENAPTNLTAVRQIQGALEAIQADLRQMPEDWDGLRDWSERLIVRWLGKVGRFAPDQRAAAEEILALLRQMTSLETVDRRPDAWAIRSALADALRGPWRDDDRYGEGVFVGRLEDAVGLEFDAVFILGLVEGVAPPSGHEDPILDGATRDRLGMAPSAGSQRGPERDFAWHAVRQSAGHVVVSTTRVSPRDGRVAVASRWWTESLELSVGEAVNPERLGLWADGVRLITRASMGASLQSRVPGAVDEWDVAYGRAFGPWALFADPDVPRQLERSAVASSRRLEPVFTPREGAIPAFQRQRFDDRSWSVSLLDNLLDCPRRFYYAGLLRLPMESDRGRVWDLSAQDRGMLYHAVLAQFTSKCREVAWDGDEPEARTWLQAEFGRHADRAERDGLVGELKLWNHARCRIGLRLEGVAQFQAELARNRGRRPVDQEVSLGNRVGGWTWPTSTGNVSVTGRIDRVDRDPSGAWDLVDYKTGSIPKASVQLALYQTAWASANPGYDVRTEYWPIASPVITAKSDIKLAETLVRLERLVGAVRSGMMVPNPGKDSEHCQFCAFEAICPASRARDWDRKLGDPSWEPWREPNPTLTSNESEETE